MQLRQLTVDLQELFGITAIDPARPLFRALTHLRLNHRPELNFGELPALTHLCLPNHYDQHSISSTLANCSSLIVLIHTDWSGLIQAKKHLLIDDPRFVLMSLSFNEWMVDWKLGAKGGRDFWARAENFVARRRRDEIEPGMSFRTRRNTPLTVLASFSLALLD
jgi:hypothetical protein